MGLRQRLRNALASAPVIEGGFRRLVWSRIHFIELEMRVLNALPARSFDISVDVGAALGEYSWVLNRKSARVFAFEPGHHHSRYIKRLLLGSRITLVRAAVGAADGTVKLFTPSEGAGALYSEGLYWATASQTNPISSAADVSVEEVQQVSLDSYFRDRVGPGRSIDLIKIDVEGYEIEVVEGARETIAKYHPIIICEIEKRHTPRYQEVFALLRAEGYQCYVFRAAGPTPFDDETLDALQVFNSDPGALVGRSDDSAEIYRDYINNFVFQHPASRTRLAP